MIADSSRILFHEYALSPFSEKIRRILGYKNLEYASVDQPMWMPKPHLTPLTDGYRRIPVMQIGADIYCDSALIARKIERLHPERPILPPALDGIVHAVEQWADKHLFAACVPIVFSELAPVLPAELIDDRKRMRPDLNVETLKLAVPTCAVSLATTAERIDRTLAAQPFLLGKDFTLADAALFHGLWFARNAPTAGAILARYARLGEWMKRMEAFGSGRPTPLAAADALALARKAEPREEPIGGSIGVTTEELVIERNTGDVGRIRQHFPRAGYVVRKA
jgi:glutathione S-transferase